MGSAAPAVSDAELDVLKVLWGARGRATVPPKSRGSTAAAQTPLGLQTPF